MTTLNEPVVNSGPEIVLRSTVPDSPRLSCILLGIAKGELHVRSDKWVEPSSRVTAQLAHLSFSGEVLYCTRKDSWFRVCIDLLGEDAQRRREPRLGVHQKGKVIALSGDGGQSSEPGVLVDVAITGMRIELSHHVEIGTMIFIETESALVAGEVRHCRKGSNGRFEAGVAVTDVIPDTHPGRSTRGFVRNVRKRVGETISGHSNPRWK